MRRLLAVALIVLGIAILLGRGRTIASAVLGKSKTTTSSVTERVTSIVLKTGNGDVHLQAGSSTTIRRTEHWTFARPRVSITRSNGVLTVSASCPGGLFNRCWVDVDATVPADTAATVTTNNGDVAVLDLGGPRVSVRTNNGDVDLSSLTSDAVRVRTGNGDVHVVHARSSIDVQTNNGDVQTTLDAKKSVTVKTNNGDVALALPGGAYATEIHTNNGDVTKTGITGDSSRAERLSIRTNNGDVRVTGRP
jgi:DUF4097 and DUF4098 domain-containing protein YvlB